MKNLHKKIHLIFLTAIVLVGLFLMFWNIKQVKAYIRNLNRWAWITWDNSNFLNQDFWNSNPTDEDIIYATFWRVWNQETIYNLNRDGFDLATDCHDIRVVYTWDLQLNNLEDNTIYVLTWDYNIISTWINISSANCVAIISNSPNWTTLQSTTQLDYMIEITKSEHTIIDNISINGTWWLLAWSHDANNYGIKMTNGWNRSTINNVNIFNNSIDGLSITWNSHYNTINHINTYNNCSNGISLHFSSRNVINNLKSYNNSRIWVQIRNSSMNTINNSQIFKNNSAGIDLYYSNNITINNSQIYSNNLWVYLRLTTNSKLNNTYLYRNTQWTSDLYLDGDSTNNKFYGHNIRRIWWTIGNITPWSHADLPDLNWQDGGRSSPQDYEHYFEIWDFATNPRNYESKFLYPWETSYEIDQNINANYKYTTTEKYSYGSWIFTQTQPVRYLWEAVLKTRWTWTYNTSNYIGSNVPKISGDFSGMPWLPWGTSITWFEVLAKTVPFNSLIDYYNVFGNITSHVYWEIIEMTTWVFLETWVGSKKIIPQIWWEDYYATHWQKTTQIKCGWVWKVSVEGWEECDLWTWNGTNSACSEICTWNIPSCEMQVNNNIISSWNFAIVTLTFPSTWWILASWLDLWTWMHNPWLNWNNPSSRIDNEFLKDYSRTIDSLEYLIWSNYAWIWIYNLSLNVYNPLNTWIFHTCTEQVQVIDPCQLSAEPNPVYVNQPINFNMWVNFTGEEFLQLILWDWNVWNINSSGFLSTGYTHTYIQTWTYDVEFRVKNNFYLWWDMNYQTCSIQVEVFEHLPNLFVNKSMSPSQNITTNSLITYTINYGNTGNGTGVDVVVTDTIPNNFTGNWNHLGVMNGNVLTLFEWDLAPGQTGQVILTGYATASGLLVNTASISWSNHNQVDFIITGDVFDNICGNGILEVNEQCDLWTNNSSTGACNTSCLLNYPSCIINAAPTTGYAPLDTTFTISNVNTWRARFDALYFGDGTTGNVNTWTLQYWHTYNQTWNFTWRLYVSNIYSGNIQTMCETNITAIQYEYCGDGIVQNPNSDGFAEQCDLWINNSSTGACNTSCNFTTPSCTLSVNPNTIHPWENVNFTINLSHNWVPLNYLNFGNGFGFNFGWISGILQTGYVYSYNLDGIYTPVVTIQSPIMWQNIYCTGWHITVSTLPIPNLFVNKSMTPSQNITTNSLITYTINYWNTGNGTGVDVIVTDTIPNNFTGNWNHLGVMNGNVLTLFEWDLAPGQTGQVILTGYATASGLLVNTASISWSNHNQVDFIITGDVFDNICGNGILEVNEQCDLWTNNSSTGACNTSCNFTTPSCSFSVPQTVNVGTQFTITWTVNQSWVAFSGINLWNWSYYSFGGLSGVMQTIYNYTYNSTWNYTQTMYVYNPLNTGTIISCDWITQAIWPNLFVNKSISPTSWITMETLITYTINYGNNWSGVALNVLLTDIIPNRFTGNWNNLWTLSGNILRVFSGTLAPGQTGQVILTGYATDRWQMTNTAMISWSNASPRTWSITTTVLRNICGNWIVEIWEYCDDWANNGKTWYCETDCSMFIRDYEHGSAWIICKYSDEDYIDNGPFIDTLNHRWYSYIETMRNSCLHRWRWTNFGLRKYDPDEHITKAEVLKTLVKIMGIAKNDFDIVTEDAVYNGTQIFYDVSKNHWFSWYTSYAYSFGLTNGLFNTVKNEKYLKPDDTITRYDTIRKIMEVYKKIINDNRIDISSRTNLTDMISNNPYYNYVREAEVLGIISGVPQKNGTYKFDWDRPLTRAEFAKVVSIPFGELLFLE